MNGYVKTPEQVEQESKKLQGQFEDFLKTKGIVAKFKLAFEHMGENVAAQREADRAQLEAVRNSEENQQFRELLHTKGFKAKVRLVVENIKKSAAESGEKTRAHIAAVNAQTQAQIAVASGKPAVVEYDEKTLEKEFKEFLKAKGLDGAYAVTVVKEND